jgi:hypothetical protein
MESKQCDMHRDMGRDEDIHRHQRHQRPQSLEAVPEIAIESITGTVLPVFVFFDGYCICRLGSNKWNRVYFAEMAKEWTEEHYNKDPEKCRKEIRDELILFKTKLSNYYDMMNWRPDGKLSESLLRAVYSDYMKFPDTKGPFKSLNKENDPKVGFDLLYGFALCVTLAIDLKIAVPHTIRESAFINTILGEMKDDFTPVVKDDDYNGLKETSVTIIRDL